jgi:hypothetical protein
MARASDGKPLDIESLTEYLASAPAAVPAHRPAQGGCGPRGRHHERHLCRAPQGAAGAGDANRGGGGHGRALHDRLGGRGGAPVAPHGAPRGGQPADIHRYTAEFFALAKSVRAAQKAGGNAGGASFRAAGGAGQEQQAARRQRPGRGAGGGLAVAVRLRPARQRHPPGAAARAGRDPLSHRRRAAPVYQMPMGVHERHDRAHQAAGPHGRGGKAPPAGRPHQDPQPARRRGRDAPVHAAHGLWRKDGDADLRPRQHRQGPGCAGLCAARRAALGGAGQAPARHHPGDRAPPARARPPRCIPRSSAWPPKRSTSARWKTRSR